MAGSRGCGVERGLGRAGDLRKILIFEAVKELVVSLDISKVVHIYEEMLILFGSHPHIQVPLNPATDRHAPDVFAGGDAVHGGDQQVVVHIELGFKVHAGLYPGKEDLVGKTLEGLL